MTDERRIDRMTVCVPLGKGVLAIGAFILAALCLLGMHRCFYMTDVNGRLLEVLQTAKDLQVAIWSYEYEYHAFPIAAEKGSDSHLRSRGQLLAELFPFDDAILNFKKVKFIDLPMARERKSGLWQDSGEWVLSDAWGEPFHIIIDTNEDNVIANPDSDSAKATPQIPSRILIYSSGPDRDPKTWHDNICSWRD